MFAPANRSAGNEFMCHTRMIVCSSYTCGQMLVPKNTVTNPKNYLNYKYNREGNLKWEKEL
jgi:hypothetical protein